MWLECNPSVWYLIELLFSCTWCRSDTFVRFLSLLTQSDQKRIEGWADCSLSPFFYLNATKRVHFILKMHNKQIKVCLQTMHANDVRYALTFISFRFAEYNKKPLQINSASGFLVLYQNIISPCNSASRFFVLYHFATKSIQNDQHLKVSADPPYKIWEYWSL